MLTQKGHRFDETWALTEGLYDHLERTPSLRGEVVIDDRIDLSIGERIKQMARAGYPFLVGIGKKVGGGDGYDAISDDDDDGGDDDDDDGCGGGDDDDDYDAAKSGILKH